MDFSKMGYDPLSEQLVNVLQKKSQRNTEADKHFFRTIIAYYFAKIASMMRAYTYTKTKQEKDIRLFTLALAPSGYGKGFTTSTIEQNVIHSFRERYELETKKLVTEDNLIKLTAVRAKRKKVHADELLPLTHAEYQSNGEDVFSFDSGTAPAVKQLRHKLLMSGIGSICLEMDEVGSNFSNNQELINIFIELYDGIVKQKLTKTTSENKRNEEIVGMVPTNMLLFGTPSKLMDGGRTESDFYSMLETGYARRFLYANVEKDKKEKTQTAAERFASMTDTSLDLTMAAIASKLEDFADVKHYRKKISMPEDVELKYIEYMMYCEEGSREFKEHENLHASEMEQRHYKALHLAGVYAFVSGSTVITEDHLNHAILLCEDSGRDFHSLMTRDNNYVKLAKYIADIGKEVTNTDLHENLPFYKGSENQRKDLLNLAITWGYTNNIIIKKAYRDGIEFISGESLPKTDLDKLIFSHSFELAHNYVPREAPYDSLQELVSTNGVEYTSHHFKDKHRTGDKALPEFNLIMIDVDKDMSLDTARMLLKDYKCMFSTTKRHRKPGYGDRFRIILPLSHTLSLSSKEYSEFMENIFAWLPFESDEQTKDIARKWSAHEGCEIYHNDGELVDAMAFIPRTRKSEEQKLKNDEIGSLTNLERWFRNNTGEGNRSNMMHKYARALIDSGYKLEQIRSAVLTFNHKIPDPLPEDEINSTIMITVTKELTKREIHAEHARELQAA